MVDLTYDLLRNSGYTAYMLGYKFNPLWPKPKQSGYIEAQIQSNKPKTINTKNLATEYPYNLLRDKSGNI